MSGPNRNPDKLNTIGIVVVGICGAVLVYVTIVALQAFYVNDTSEVQTMADYGGQDTSSKSLRAEQMSRINEYGTNPKPAAPKANEAPKPQTYRMPIDLAMKLVVDGAKTDPSMLIPQVGRSDKGTVLPIFGRPKLIPPPAPAAPAPAPADAAPAAGAPAAGAPAAGASPASTPDDGKAPAAAAPSNKAPAAAAAPTSKSPAAAAAPTSKSPAAAAAPSNKAPAAAAAPKGNGK